MHFLDRFNGWQRIWLVLTTLALLYALGWGLVEGSKGGGERVRQEVVDGFRSPECKQVLDMPALSKLSPEPQRPCWELYLYRSIYENAATTAEGYRKDIESRRREWMLGTLGVGLAFWGIGCAALYLCGWITAWIRRGFAHSARS